MTTSRRDLRMLLGACLWSALVPLASAQIECGVPDDDLLAQCPNLMANGSPPAVGLASDLGAVFTRADDFVLPAGGVVKEVRFWGFYLDIPPFNCGPEDDQFGARFWSDVGGLPGEPALGDLAFEVTRSAMPVVQLGPFDVFEYSLVFTDGSVVVPAGVPTWLEIYNDLPTCTWYWLTTAGSNGLSASRIGPPLEAPPAWSSGTAEPYDLAFTLCTVSCLSASFCDADDGSAAACPCGGGAASAGCEIAQGT